MESRNVSTGRNIAVLGAGSWGTALALVAARNGHNVSLWARNAEVASAIARTRRNPRYLPGAELPENIAPTTSIDRALSRAEVALIVIPAQEMRPVAELIRPHLDADTVVVSAAKGVENGSLMRMSEVFSDVLGPEVVTRFVALSGPSFAQEVAKGDPTAIVAASVEREPGEAVQHALSSSLFRVYTNPDLVGVELGGAVKNVIAIAAGVVRGLGMGTNTVAAIITRGLAEMTRFGLAQGGKVETLAGLAGLGDLVLTCTGELSRNRFVGVELGRGRALAEVLSQMNEVAEGVTTTRAVHELGLKIGVDMPITASVYALLYEKKPAREAALELMERPLKDE